ncbi:hypothetical protein HJFPF1_01954 [Paramyrothecium foliicola]|nr:hypothetical protein HJFPF1_01954 [Paramyrothecium foliicola]
MAAASVLPPGHHYPPQPSFPHHHSHPPGPSIANMISSGEPRKAHDGNDSPNRQSLPSLSEVISGTKPAPYPPPAPGTIQPGSSLPSPFVSAVRQYSEADKHSPPQPLHPTSSFPPRQEPLPAFSGSPRPPFNGRPGLPPVPDRRPTPPSKLDHPPNHHMVEPPKPMEAHPMNGSYAHAPPQPPPPPPQQPIGVPYQPGQLPPGQVPLPNYPISPRHAMPHIPGGFDPRGPHPPHPEDGDLNRARYDATVNRHFETWSYQDSLSRIGSASRTVFNFAEAYGRIAQEQQGPHHIPERLPTEREVADMLANNELVKRSLEQVRDLVQASIQSERAREGAKMKGPYEEDQDMAMYADGGKPQYGMAEGKRKRGVSQNSNAVAHSLDEQKTDLCSSELLPPGDATAVTGSTHQNGDVAPMVLELFATPVVYITPNWRGSVN